MIFFLAFLSLPLYLAYRVRTWRTREKKAAEDNTRRFSGKGVDRCGGRRHSRRRRRPRRRRHRRRRRHACIHTRLLAVLAAVGRLKLGSSFHSKCVVAYSSFTPHCQCGWETPERRRVSCWRKNNKGVNVADSRRRD
jgi:hypothetical protein